MKHLPLLAAVLAALSLPAAAVAQSSYRHGRIRHVEPGATLQRASETGAEEALPNIPFLPGDRVWTDAGGRLELQFADGSVVRLDSRGKLDYVSNERDRIVLRLWSGALFVHARRGDPDFLIETSDAAVEMKLRGVYRVDARGGETLLSVYDGEASLVADRRLEVGGGERAMARAGFLEGPEAGIPDRADDFARWDEERQREAQWADRHEYLPEAVAPYAAELDRYGDWYYEGEVGHVWRPYVGPGWHPYLNGRWIWTAYGWTWLPYDAWGWAPFHYGRWGHSPAIGWYWIPGAAWAPAWVSWAVDGGSIGWCPLGYGDRPVVVTGGRYRGRAIARGTAAQAWIVAPRAALGAPDIAQRARTGVGPSDVARFVATPREGAVGRDLRIIEGTRPLTGEDRPVPRNIRTKPAPGDTVHELRSDPMTTIPAPQPRRRYESEREREAERAKGRPRERREAAPMAPEGAPPARALPVPVAPAPAGGPEARPVIRRGDERRPSEPEREVSQPIVRALGRSRPAGEAAAPRGERGAPRPESAGPRRAAPPREAAPPPARPRAAARPEKERKQQ